eukprot:CAMPEP_0194206766 /NCGR_PEP_ID=MMETSP0156-20130528/5714_1 /TAXON_ID=33649 /ORGANISM="Thalassionema nitzschioides, Strain L26-B" /LENGTH=701 /DNA_ID=CAMNT_0038933377 /DNA_START=456 /DNA_END=2561 /DNA_ORIENTATION=-
MGFAFSHYACESEDNSIYMQQDDLQDDDFRRYVTVSTDDTTIPGTSLVWWVAFGFLWLTQLVEVFLIVVFWCRLFGKPPTSSLAESSLQHELVEEMWAERCTTFCNCLGMSTCFLFGGKNMALGDYGAVARALTDYFENGNLLDLVPSDIVMGLMVLRSVQRKRILESRNEVLREKRVTYSNSSQEDQVRNLNSNSSHSANSFGPLLGNISSNSIENAPLSGTQTSFFLMHEEGEDTFYELTSRKVLNMNKPFDRFTLQEGTRFARYQLAIYTWLIYLYMHPVSGFARLLLKSSCGCCDNGQSNNIDDDEAFLSSGIPSGLVIGDNWCKVHKAALMLQAGIHDDNTELVYAQLLSSFSDIPYCIIIDHTWKSVVLAIRGTFSLEDCVTDVLIEPETLQQMGDEFGFDGEGQFSHGGIISCARVVYRDLQRHCILDKLLYGETAKYPNYTLRVVGHSLGAGTATLVSYMLRQRFPSVRCLNYSPPGCSFTWRIATECKDWCNSFVLDSDLVPRLSIDSLEHLRDEVLGIIGRVKVSKADVARKTLPSPKYLCRRNIKHDDIDSVSDLVDSLICQAEDVSQSNYSLTFENFKNVQEERRSKRGHMRSVKLYPPGRIVHFTKTGEKHSCMRNAAQCLTCWTTNLGHEYTPIWVKNDDFNEIVISTTMGTDHFPNRLTKTMENLSEQYGIDVTKYVCLDADSPPV